MSKAETMRFVVRLSCEPCGGTGDVDDGHREAAALAQDIAPDEIRAALDAMGEQLDAAGLDKAWRNLEPGPFLEYLLDVLGDWRALMEQREGYGAAYTRLQTLAKALERDFTAAGSEVSKRLAARVHAALEEAAAMLTTDRQET